MKENNFNEAKLINSAYKAIKELYRYDIHDDREHFRTQVEIAGCIIDGLMFLEGCRYHSKIIGFEAKTNKDNYKRLYNQINSYLAICDDVYLVIQDKEPPKDLPFFVGVIKVSDDNTEIAKRATSLKHSISATECWATLLKAFNSHVGVVAPTSRSTLDFFDCCENIKRKLIWNQFVVGFHQTYVKDYIPLTAEEKRVVRAFFGEGYQLVLGEEL